MSIQGEKRTNINKLGEFGLIDHLTKNFINKNRSTIYGIGDDAAIIENNNLLTVITTDLLVENIHFDLIYTPLKYLGYKAVVINITDIFAMNAIPKQITVSLGISNRFSVEALDEIYKGIREACAFYNVDLIGGDTSSSMKGLIISITAIGQAQKGKVVYRNRAKVGDLICITGDLGAAFLGMQILEREKQVFMAAPTIEPKFDEQNYLIERFLKPEARHDIIETFEKNNLLPTSMIDISDGLASELHHICKQSKVGAFLEESGVPIHNDAQLKAIEFGYDPITCALNGGEDYELLFTINPSNVEKVKYIPGVYIAGEIINKKEGIQLHTKGGNIHPISAQGWK